MATAFSYPESLESAEPFNPLGLMPNSHLLLTFVNPASIVRLDTKRKQSLPEFHGRGRVVSPISKTRREPGFSSGQTRIASAQFPNITAFAKTSRSRF
jgi:hypothetical protein